MDVDESVLLTSGQHCASKVGNGLYCSCRGMIPILRNCFVYFEMSVSTIPLPSMVLHHASLSIGLSTLQMPLNMLVGTCNGSVGLCSTGQILAGGRWCSPLEPQTYGSGSVVGCLVYLDDESAYYTFDGVMVAAHIVFNLNGQIITPLEEGGEAIESHNNDDGLNDLSFPTLPVFVPRETELFPTLTLHSTHTDVMCRFCAEDIGVKCREEIGAPSGVTIYAIDGSVIFGEE